MMLRVIAERVMNRSKVLYKSRVSDAVSSSSLRSEYLISERICNRLCPIRKEEDR